jgi:hypothetical protein
MTKKEFLEAFLFAAMKENEYWNADHILQWGLKAWSIINE